MGGAACQAAAISLQPPPLISRGDGSAVGLDPAASPHIVPTVSEDKPEPQQPVGLWQLVLRNNGHAMAGIPPVGLFWAQRAVLTPCHPSLVSQNRQVPVCPNAKDQLRCDTSRRGVGCVCVPVCIYLGASSGCLSLCADMRWTWPYPWPGAARQCIPVKKV